jgi:hypothetical protein
MKGILLNIYRTFALQKHAHRLCNICCVSGWLSLCPSAFPLATVELKGSQKV